MNELDNSNVEIKIAKLETKVDFVLAEIKDIKDGTFSDIASLKRDKADRKELESLQKVVNDDIEKRVESLEGKNNWYTGALALVGIVAALVAYIYFTQQDVQNKQIDTIISNQLK